MEKLRYERPIIKKMSTGLMNKFGTRTENVPVTHIESVPVKTLINEYGSPLFVLSEKQIRRNYQFAGFFTRKDRGPKLYQVLNMRKPSIMAFPATKSFSMVPIKQTSNLLPLPETIH